MIRITQEQPHKTVVKEVVCHNCGVTIEYTPNELKEGKSTDYTGSTDFYKYIECPKCKKEIKQGY